MSVINNAEARIRNSLAMGKAGYNVPQTSIEDVESLLSQFDELKRTSVSTVWFLLSAFESIKSEAPWFEQAFNAGLAFLRKHNVLPPAPESNFKTELKNKIAQALFDRFQERGKMRMGGPSFRKGTLVQNLPASYKDDFMKDADAVMVTIFGVEIDDKNSI